MQCDTERDLILFKEPSAEQIAASKSYRDDVGVILKRLHIKYDEPAEFFEPGKKLELVGLSKIRAVKHINQMSFCQMILLKHEHVLKLMTTLNGYLIALDQSHVLLTYLSARYVLELHATIAYIDEKIRSALTIPSSDWKGRGEAFFSIACRGRYASSWSPMSDYLSKEGASSSAIKPINITESIKRLDENPDFNFASKTYDYLSNMCHHNGSSHRLFGVQMRKVDRIMTPVGQMRTEKPSNAVALVFGSQLAMNWAFVKTAEIVNACAKWSDHYIEEIPLQPFSDHELFLLTGNTAIESKLH
jgi:hypothetical protein